MPRQILEHSNARAQAASRPPAPVRAQGAGGEPTILEPARLAKEGFEAEALPYLDAVYYFALRLRRGDTDEAADLAQETFLRAYRGWHTYQAGSNVLSWLFTICRNAAIRQGELSSIRRERNLTRLGVEGTEALGQLVHDAGLDIGDPEGAYFDSLVDEGILRAIDDLPIEFREAVVLSDLHDLSYHEVAAVLGVPGGTVKSRIHRGRRLLQERLREYAVEMGYLRDAVA